MDVSRINFTEVDRLINRLKELSKDIGNGINTFSDGIDKLKQHNFIEGASVEFLGNSSLKIQDLYSQFTNYINTMIENMENLKSQAQTIENESATTFSKLASIDPTSYSDYEDYKEFK